MRSLAYGVFGAAIFIAAPVFAQHEGHGAPMPANGPDGAPLWNQADQYYDPDEMAAARAQARGEHGGAITSFMMADRFEGQFGGDEDMLVWDLQGWRGGDLNKLWIKAEGDYAHGDFEDAAVQALWSRAISPFFDFQAGVRQTIEPESETAAVIGFQGLAPQWFEVDGALFIGEATGARFEAEYDLRLTQRVVLQPRIELEGAFDAPAGEPTGLTGLDAGVRLRFEPSRQFAPYVGVEWQGALGNARDMIEAGGGESEQTVILIGVRAWR